MPQASSPASGMQVHPGSAKLQYFALPKLVTCSLAELACAFAAPLSAAALAAVGQCLDALDTTGAVPETDLGRLPALQQQLHTLAFLLPALLQARLTCLPCCVDSGTLNLLRAHRLTGLAGRTAISALLDGCRRKCSVQQPGWGAA